MIATSPSMQQYIVDSSLTYRCHIELADCDKPIAAIAYQGKFYSFFKTCADWETTEKIARRMKSDRIITKIKKGWAIWAYEF
ncbi:MAG: hypothetical protein SFT94_00205 [Pseudanabaenaceae cyanobacterium bins.68]|nr:hypothetical protein [Pseudanabaenaceae cyanobacterium bins.68]